MKHHTIRRMLGLLLLAVLALHAAGFADLDFVDRLEAIGYDARLRLAMPSTRFPGIAIVDIDEKSLAEEGRWPWGRDRLGSLLDELFQRQGAAVVGFDVVFAERDNSSGLDVLQRLARHELRDVPQYRTALQEIAPRLERDNLFAAKMKGRAVILGYYFTSPIAGATARTSGALPAPVFPPHMFDGLNVPSVSASGYGANLQELQQAAAGAGHFTPWPDFDGITRRIPMLIEYRGAYYEALSLAVARAALGIDGVVPVIPSKDAAYAPVEWLKLGARKIPVDEYMRAMVPYRGAQGSFQYLSASDLLRHRVRSGALAGKIVLVGTTALGLMDLRATPVASTYPGVEVHANMIAGILEQNVKQRPAYVRGAELATLLAVGLLLAWLLPRLSPLRASLATLAVLGLVIVGNLAAWQYGNLVLPLASSLLLILGLFLLNMSYGFFVETRAKRQISDMFGQYVPPELVDEMSRHSGAFDMQGESREMTVLFSDVRDFTRISEGLEPRQLSELMNAYLTPMTQAIHKHRGTIDKYIGDAIMAFWGAPLADPEHARHAVLAGLTMQQALRELNREFKSRGWPELAVGIGLNSGAMSVGNMGSRFRRAYTVMGDAVNLAARLEGLTKQYGIAMIVGQDTRLAAPGVVFRELDRVRVKGRHEPVAIFEPVGAEGEVDAARLADIERFHRVLAHYRAQQWDEAQAVLAELQQAEPGCLLYQRYTERIDHFRTHPPQGDWDGVFEFQTK
jgi:adenylate cyclase